MSKWISNIQIKNAIKNIEDEDLNDNFVALFSSNHMNKFINHAVMISEKQGKYPFVIANADTSGKGGTQWWSILDIEPKTDIFSFDYFLLHGLKHFIIWDDRNIKQILFGTEKIARIDSKITLFNIRLNLKAYKNLSVEELDALSDTASKFFHFIQAFGNKLKLGNYVNIW